MLLMSKERSFYLPSFVFQVVRVLGILWGGNISYLPSWIWVFQRSKATKGGDDRSCPGQRAEAVCGGCVSQSMFFGKASPWTCTVGSYCSSTCLSSGSLFISVSGLKALLCFSSESLLLSSSILPGFALLRSVDSSGSVIPVLFLCIAFGFLVDWFDLKRKKEK